LIFLTGGARSGKSLLAMTLAKASQKPVRYIATATASDEEMEQRIAVHRKNRPGDWTVIEAPIELGEAVSGAQRDECLILDCVTLWISNLMPDHDDDHIALRVDDVVEALTGRHATVVVSNEVGSGLVPMDPVGRRFRDLQGSANEKVATAANSSYLVIACKTLELGVPNGS